MSDGPLIVHVHASTYAPEPSKCVSPELNRKPEDVSTLGLLWKQDATQDADVTGSGEDCDMCALSRLKRRGVKHISVNHT